MRLPMSGLDMPKPDAETMRRRAEIVADMRIIVPGEGVVDAANEMRAFESDGLTAYRQLPLVVVLPETVAQVSRVLKYGLTANNVLGIEMVLMNGEVVRLGGGHLDQEGYDLLGVMTGSEGLLGVVTEVTVRILKKPETARALLVGFPTSEQGGQCVADIIGAGIIPGGMEMMDRPAIHAAEDFVHAGYPLDVEALLIIELDGPGVEVDELIGRVEAIAKGCGSTTLQISTSEVERNLF